MTPLQEVSHQEWLERKILSKTYKLCYEVLQLVDDIRISGSELESWDSVGLAEAYANEILLIRDIMNEDG